MQIVFKNLNELRPYEKNARVHSKKQIERIVNSIKEFGFTNPILIDKTGLIIAGHGRLEAAKILDLKEVPTIALENLTQQQIQAYILADNRIAELSEWDNDLLSVELKDLLSADFDLSLIGFENFKFDVEKSPADEAIPTNVETRCKLEDVWQLGDHTLMCGDSTNPLHTADLFGQAEPTLMVTDPPYGVSYDPKWRADADCGVGEHTKGKVLNDDRVDWTDTYSLFTGSVAYVWHAGRYTHIVAQNLEDCGFQLISQIIWAKQHFTLSRGDYHWQHEPCWYAVKKDCKHNWQGARDQSTLWKIDNLNAFGGTTKDEEQAVGHGTQKPIDCMLKPILNNTQEGDSVYDPFGGSGTTLIACEKSKRVCYMMELSPQYCDIILSRWEKFTNKKATLK